MNDVRIAIEEWYPVYNLSEDDGRSLAVSDEILDDWKRVLRAFARVQQEMRRFHEMNG